MLREKNRIILVAEDDVEDRMLIREAFQETRLSNYLRFVEDGEELMDYLERRGSYTDPIQSPLPCLILLDLNMPRKTGWEALGEIKNSQSLRRIPVVILTTSGDTEDVVRGYDMGVSSFISKPERYELLIEMTQTLKKYWFEIVQLPPRVYNPG